VDVELAEVRHPHGEVAARLEATKRVPPISVTISRGRMSASQSTAKVSSWPAIHGADVP